MAFRSLAEIKIKRQFKAACLPAKSGRIRILYLLAANNNLHNNLQKILVACSLFCMSLLGGYSSVQNIPTYLTTIIFAQRRHLTINDVALDGPGIIYGVWPGMRIITYECMFFFVAIIP